MLRENTADKNILKLDPVLSRCSTFTLLLLNQTIARELVNRKFDLKNRFSK